jgi:hypothetical protein
MPTKLSGLDALQDIRNMMERSSRFISLSGWSGVAAGISALVGSWLGWSRLRAYYSNEYTQSDPCIDCLRTDLVAIAGGVFIVALLTAFLFTYLRSKKEGVPLWGAASRRLLWNTMIPLAVGAIFIGRLIQEQDYTFVAAASLIFYGLALVNGSRYTLGEVKWLGYAEILTGLTCLWFPQKGIYFWAFGFGLLHIVYGFSMWWKYERPGTGKL